MPNAIPLRFNVNLVIFLWLVAVLRVLQTSINRYLVINSAQSAHRMLNAMELCFNVFLALRKVALCVFRVLLALTRIKQEIKFVPVVLPIRFA